MPEIIIKAGDGGVQVACSQDITGNLLLQFGLLEVAKVALMEQAKANERRVQLAAGPIPAIN